MKTHRVPLRGIQTEQIMVHWKQGGKFWLLYDLLCQVGFESALRLNIQPKV